MPDQQNPQLYRDLAERARVKAAAATDVDLQASYFEIATDYETLAQTLERIQRKLRLSEPA